MDCLSLELQEVVCLDDGILFLRRRLAGVVLKGEWFSSITRDGGREEQPTRKFFISFVEYWCTNPKQTCQWLLKKKKTKHKKTKTKESYQKYDLVSPTPQEGIKARHHDQSWASEWVRREQLCWRLSSIRQVGGSSPPTHFKWSCCIPQFPKNLLLVLQMCWPSFSLIMGDMLSRKSVVIIVKLAVE